MNGEKVHRTGPVPAVGFATNGVAENALVWKLANPMLFSPFGQSL
jgi:hypothetical protein